MCSQSDDPTVSPNDPLGEIPEQDRHTIFADGVLDRHFLGRLEPNEAARVDAYFGTPVRRRLLRYLGAWIDGRFEPTPPDRTVAQAEFWSRAASNGQLDAGHARRKPAGMTGASGARTLRTSIWIGAVAAVIGGVVMTVLKNAEPNQPKIGATRVYATNAQQRAIVDLDDETRMTLAPGTTVRVPHFGTRSRTVILDGGEAYFEVAHASGVPFIVRSGVATAQVLGTAFLVRHGANDSHTRIAVTDGKVQVTTSAHRGARSDAGVTLTSGQAGDVTDSTTQVRTADDLAPGTEWQPGRIVFHHTPLATVLQTVSWWYGYQFRYADSTMRTRSVTMMVSTQSSADALAMIEQVLAVNLTVVGDTVTLVPQSPQTRRNAPRIRTYDVWTPTREVGR